MENSPNTGQQEKIIVQVDSEIANLVPAFLKHTGQHIQEMKRCLETGDLVSIRQGAHKLKGTAKLYGFDALSNFARSLEEALTQEDLESVRQWLVQLETYMDRVTITVSP